MKSAKPLRLYHIKLCIYSCSCKDANRKYAKGGTNEVLTKNWGKDSGIQGKSDNKDFVNEYSLNRCWNS